MHRGVRQFLKWVGSHRDQLELNPPATSAEMRALEHSLGGPLPTDLRLMLTRFNGGELPVGKVLPVGLEPGTIGAAVRAYADSLGKDFLDPELLLPFCETVEGSLLAFDRSAGPVSDTWPIVDYYPDTGDERLIHRTLDGWCENCVGEWQSGDHDAEFTLEVYLRKGQRHVRTEPDVATAHATVAHAYKRAGRPDDSLASYLAAARCVPPLPWCDWEALKIAVLMGDERAALESSNRLARRGPEGVWRKRETTARWVAQVVGPLACRSSQPERWARVMDNLVVMADEEDRDAVVAIRSAFQTKTALPELDAIREEPVVAPMADAEAWWHAVRAGYAEGVVRDEDLLLEPSLAPLRAKYPLGECLRIRREF